MNSPTPTALVVDGPPAADLCAACGHPLLDHDAISSRWCAATKLGIGSRDCLCSARVSNARVLSHY